MSYLKMSDCNVGLLMNFNVKENFTDFLHTLANPSSAKLFIQSAFFGEL